MGLLTILKKVRSGEMNLTNNVFMREKPVRRDAKRDPHRPPIAKWHLTRATVTTPIKIKNRSNKRRKKCAY